MGNFALLLPTRDTTIVSEDVMAEMGIVAAASSTLAYFTQPPRLRCPCQIACQFGGTLYANQRRARRHC